MQKFALFFLFAVTISLAAPLEFVLAQEMSEDEMVEEEAMDEEMMDGAVMEDEVMVEEEMMDDTMMEEQAVSPLKQMAMGTEPHEIQCSGGQILVFKSSNWRPACVNEWSFDILLERGWISSHDPSDEELATMVGEYMASLPEIIEEPENGEIEIEEDVIMEGETDTGGGNETEPQSHTIELRENMEMGAQ